MIVSTWVLGAIRERADPVADVEQEHEPDRREREADDAVDDEPGREAPETVAQGRVGRGRGRWRGGRWRDGGHHGEVCHAGRQTVAVDRCGVTCSGAPARAHRRRQSSATTSPTAVGSIRTSGASSEAYSTNAAGGSTRRSGKTRPRACGQYVPQWIGTAARGRTRRRASAALSGSRWRPRPRVGPQPQTGISARSIVAERPHPLEQVRVAGEVDRLACRA